MMSNQVTMLFSQQCPRQSKCSFVLKQLHLLMNIGRVLILACPHFFLKNVRCAAITSMNRLRNKYGEASYLSFFSFYTLQ
jgi:hypothetical protein